MRGFIDILYRGFLYLMKNLSGFILGFSLSLIGIALIKDKPSATPLRYSQNDLKINLFQIPHEHHLVSQNIFANIQKQSLQQTVSDTPSNQDVFTVAHLDTLKNDTPLPSTSDIIYSPSNVEGEEDDIILNINTDDIIPIDVNKDSLQSKHAEVSHIADDNKIAMLPDYTSEADEETSPWVIAKGSKHIKNKKLLEKYTPDIQENLLNKDLKLSSETNNDISYKVAEKIKQSIIFPIPDEILSDENLTPTFIQPKDISQKNSDVSKQKKDSKDIKTATNTSSMKILPKITPSSPSEKKTKESKGIIDSISSWLSPSSEKEEPVKTNKAKSQRPPLYNSPDNTSSSLTPNESNNSSNDAFVNFYETMQQAEQEQANNKIIPSELKLSFQPERAEISGQTLRWLKAFSEKSQEPSTFLQVRLDATAPIDLQRKRLSLLYSIFMNNGVDFKKVDTVFSLTEPDTFIIRIIKTQNNNNSI